MLTRLLSSQAHLSFGLMRVVSGLMFAFHGSRKLFGILSGHMPEVGSQLWVGGLIELVTGVCIAIGLLTTWMSFIASGTMAVAYIQFHWRFELGAHLIPTKNQGELALLYCLVFLAVACRGPEALSMDRLLERMRKAPNESS